VSEPGIPYDAVALYLILLHTNKLTTRLWLRSDEIAGPAARRGPSVRRIGEIACATGNW